VLVTIDTFRADRLGAGTPNLAKLAKSGVLFENAVTQAPLTAPSHASMFTGLYPTAHKVRDTGGFVLNDQHTTLAEVLQTQGWDTAAFVGASVLKKSFGFAQGFSVYDDRMPKPAGNSEFPERRAAEVVDRAAQWLGAQSGKPYFLWVHVFDPHGPYDPPSPFPKTYDGEVAYTDQQLGRIFEAVAKKSGNTLIAALSDHGESLSDHGEFTHGVFLYDATLRIAFALSGPGVPKNLRVKQQARAVDLTPTLLELMHVKSPEGAQGASLVPALTGKETPATFSYAESLFSKLNMGWSELRAIRTNRWKYIRAPKPELYDLAADPAETNNVIASHPSEVQDLEAKLKSIAAGSEKVETSSMDRRTADQLKSLGYVGGGSQGTMELTGKGIDPKDRINVLKLLHEASPDSAQPASRRAELLGQAIAADPSNPTVYYHLGLELANRNPADALRLYRDGIRNGVKTAWLYSRMGSLLLREGKREDAIASFEKAAQLNPTDIESLNDLGLAYLESGRLADAEKAYKWSLASNNDYALTHNGLGLVSIQKQDLTNARVHFERAVQLDPNLLEAHLNLGRLYKMQGDMKRARQSWEAFLAKASPAEYGHIIPKIRAELATMP
jgi:arylsulfatase A-like enzyme/Flp pilus assembly protein TadD